MSVASRRRYARWKAQARPVRLASELHKAGSSLNALATILGVNPHVVSRWNRGLNEPANLSAVNRELRRLGVDPAHAWAARPEGPMPPTTPPPPPPGVASLDDARRKRGLPVPQPPPTDPEETMEITSREDLEPEELTHFHLDEDPFDDIDDPENIFLSAQHQAVERKIFKAIKARRILVLTAPPGGGKSTVLRRVYARAEREKRVRLIAPASLDRQRITHAALAVAILRDLVGRDTSSMAQEARSELLRETLADQDKAGLFPALLIDEAHLLKPAALVALKHIWDSHTLFKQIAMILVGQHTLHARLKADPTVRELTGRAQLVQLQPLGGDVRGYLQWRFARVGGDADRIFAPDAYEALAARAEFPLWVNNLAVLAMRSAAAVGDDIVTRKHVARA